MESKLYFFISYSLKKQINVDDNFVVPENEYNIPKCIYMDEIFENKLYYYKKIFMINKSAEKGNQNNNYKFEFELDDDKYNISFDSKGASFIYDVKLEKTKRSIKSRKEINQNVIQYYEKMHIFMDALKKNNEAYKIDLLYKDTIDLFSIKEGFSFLIELFVEIYKNKYLCGDLLKKFKEMNQKQNNNKKYMEREPFLEKHKSIINMIISESDEYNTIDFYGLILSYLNFYDYDNFDKIINELFKNKSEDLFEILLIYNSHFIYHPINQNFDFFNKFIEYTILYKDHNFFEVGLKYIRDIETFINIIAKNKENFFDKYIKDNKEYLKYIIKLGDNLKIIKAENELPSPNFIQLEDSLDPESNNNLNIMMIQIEDEEEAKSILEKEIEEDDIFLEKEIESIFISNIIKNIESLINFSKEKNAFLIYFTSKFWNYILNNFNEPNQKNIFICSKLREIFIKYYHLVNEIFKDKDKQFTIKNDITNYYEIDEFAELLAQNIKKYIINNKELENIEKLELISEFNPYYKEKKYINKMDINIIDLFDLNDIDIEFIEDFRNMKFENIFKENINEYINKIFSKIKKISDFQNVIKLINIKNIGDKNIYFNSLEKTYDKIIKKYFEKKLENYQILARLTILFFKYEDEKNKFQFIENKIKKLDKDIIPKIFIEIMRIYINQKQNEEDEYEYEETDDIENRKVKDFGKIKDYIFEQFINLKEEKDVENIMSLIECLEGKDGKINEINDKNKGENKEITNEFLDKLLSEKNLAKKEEFFLDKNSLKILLLSKLNEKRILQKNNSEYFDNLEVFIISIKQDLEGEIKKKTFDEFLMMEESIIKQRLNLLNIIFEYYNSNDEFRKLKYINEEINEDINKLIEIKDNIIIYHRNTYIDKIKQLTVLIKDNQNKKIKDYKNGEIKYYIKQMKGLSEIINTVKNVKNNLFFNVIYENMNLWKNEEECFNKAIEKFNNIGKNLKKSNDIIKILNNKEYKNIFDIIKEKLSTNERRPQEFIDNLKNYFGITNKDLINDLSILFNIKKYEIDINSIIFFFEFFQNNNNIWNLKLDKAKFEKLFRKKGNEKKKENLQENDFKNIKNYLKELKDNEIYDYENVQNYNKLFTCLYDKKEAIEFLFSKLDHNISYLYDIIQYTDRTISITDIKNTEDCLSFFSQMEKLEDNFKILFYIQKMNENQISKFENYSRIYTLLIELNIIYDDLEKLYDEVENIIKDKTFNIYQDKDDFNLEYLIHLKNKILIKAENIDGKKNKGYNFEGKQLCKMLIIFKNFVTNLQIINDYIKVLRTKGRCLPIKISIKTKIKDYETSIEYYLDDKESNFESIKIFLYNSKNSYMSQLNIFYKDNFNLRFCFRKQFRYIMMHLENGLNIDSFLRYILNNIDNSKPIKEGYKAISRHAKDYIDKYELYNKNSLLNISSYIAFIFRENGLTLEDHYNKMKIINKDRAMKKSNSFKRLHTKENSHKNNNICKGIYLHECENNATKKYILNLYWDKIGKIPISQNILIANKETSYEEIQSFFYRSILCNHNILFVIEIDDSFSYYQQNIMISYIDNLLSEKYKNYKEQTKNNVDKIYTEKYLNSCIVFIYDRQNKNITSFLNEIKRYELTDILCDNRIIDGNEKFLSDLGNVKVITSEKCGLGKSGKIKRIIRDENKKYFYFPLGGILSKNIIFSKLHNLLNKIKYEMKEENYKDIAIHLDLTESEEISIINEFFFSLLITKFYINNEDIIYIPKDISIYIEVPICYNSYLSKFDILSIFKKDNITLENMPPFNYQEEMIDKFRKLLGINSSDKIQNFVSKYFNIIGIKKYSYYQINIFIKLFISQFNQFNSEIKFFVDGIDITKQFIVDFCRSTRYFINGGFAKLLTENDDIYKNEKNSIDILSKIYENDFYDMKYSEPLIFVNKEKMIFYKLFFSIKNNLKDDLNQIKDALNLPNEVEKEKEIKGIKYKSLLSIVEDNNYVITNDNFKKMILIIYRIKANIPVILMGETGCGKKALIIMLNQILNNGKTNVEIINTSTINDGQLCQFMDYIENKANEKKDEELWIFFDEINTCLSLSLLTEIFIKRTYNGKSINDNIRLIGACKPYRRRKINKEKYRISISKDNDKKFVYSVKPLPQSLLYYVFNFGIIDANDEKKYIYNSIKKFFSKDEKDLNIKTAEAISECHNFLRYYFDYSIVSLRDIARFSKCMEFFQKYFTIKNEIEEKDNNEKNNKIRSIICSIYICYYTRLTNPEIRFNFENNLRSALLKLVKNNINENEMMPEDFLRSEQNYLIDQIELDKGIGKNSILKENIFLIFLSVITGIPLIIIGKPGTGQSLGAQLIYKSMRGKYSKNKFFQHYPQIIQTYFQGSESTQPEDVEKLFEKAEVKLKAYKDKIEKENLPISMILFDELGLAERSKNNPLRLLYEKLENVGKEEGLSFVGISNYSLDVSKINRTLFLSVPDLDQYIDGPIQISESIAESISYKLKKEPIFEIISNIKIF